MAAGRVRGVPAAHRWSLGIGIPPVITRFIPFSLIPFLNETRGMGWDRTPLTLPSPLLRGEERVATGRVRGVPDAHRSSLGIGIPPVITRFISFPLTFACHRLPSDLGLLPYPATATARPRPSPAPPTARPQGHCPDWPRLLDPLRLR